MKKDIINLILYTMALCLTPYLIACALCYSLSFEYTLTTNPYTKALLSKYHFISSSIFVFCIFCVITAFCFPVIVTKLFLDKNWSKYVTYFYDHMQYPTIVLICYILVRELLVSSSFNIEADYFSSGNWYVYSVYGLAFVRKFIKPVYECFWILYFIFAITVVAMYLNGFIL